MDRACQDSYDEPANLPSLQHSMELAASPLKEGVKAGRAGKRRKKLAMKPAASGAAAASAHAVGSEEGEEDRLWRHVVFDESSQPVEGDTSFLRGAVLYFDRDDAAGLSYHTLTHSDFFAK